MKKLINILLLLIAVLPLVVACDEYNSDVMGEGFAPYNSLVTKYRQQVYVEFKDGGARVWGRHADKVDYQINGSSVSITSNLDSLAIFAYGHATKDDEFDFEGSLEINSSKSYALYLTGLSLRCEDRAAIKSVGNSECFLVLTDKSQNHINGSIESDGAFIFDGAGSLNIESENSAALTANGGCTCSYPVKVNIVSKNAGALKLGKGGMRIADGTWSIKSKGDVFDVQDDYVAIYGGKVVAQSESGKFVNAAADKGLLTNSSECFAIAAEKSVLVEPERQFIWQARVDTLALETTIPIEINRTPNNSTKPVKLTTITPAFNFDTPWILISNETLVEEDLVTFTNK